MWTRHSRRGRKRWGPPRWSVDADPRRLAALAAVGEPAGRHRGNDRPVLAAGEGPSADPRLDPVHDPVTMAAANADLVESPGALTACPRARTCGALPELLCQRPSGRSGAASPGCASRVAASGNRRRPRLAATGARTCGGTGAGERERLRRRRCAAQAAAATRSQSVGLSCPARARRKRPQDAAPAPGDTVVADTRALRSAR